MNGIFFQIVYSKYLKNGCECIPLGTVEEHINY